eukprot:scaffold58635_cov21-Phaeocystis_antarctica.AAC.2
MVLGHAAQFDSATSDRFYPNTRTKVDEHDPNPNLNPHQVIASTARCTRPSCTRTCPPRPSRCCSST